MCAGTHLSLCVFKCFLILLGGRQAWFPSPSPRQPHLVHPHLLRARAEDEPVCLCGRVCSLSVNCVLTCRSLFRWFLNREKLFVSCFLYLTVFAVTKFEALRRSAESTFSWMVSAAYVVIRLSPGCRFSSPGSSGHSCFLHCSNLAEIYFGVCCEVGIALYIFSKWIASWPS